MAEQHFKKKVAGTRMISDFFTELEAEDFPTDLFEQHYPEAMERWKLIGITQSCSWIWVMFTEICLVSFLAPTAVLTPIPSVVIYGVLWFFFLHPGATSTSNLLRLYSDALDIVEHRARADRVRRREEWTQTRGRDAAADDGRRAPAAPGKNPYKGELNITLSSGSLEGEGRLMAQEQNLGRSTGYMAEGKRFFKWLLQEGSLNESIATELYERSKWKRTTINDDRSFEVLYPFFAVCGALHVPDIASLFLEGDPLGIRGRVSFFYSRPAFNTAGEIRAANQRLAGGDLPEQACPQPPSSVMLLLCLFPSVAWIFSFFASPSQVATFVWPCHTTHDPVWCGHDRFTNIKGYYFRKYTLDADASRISDEHFDQHVAAQRENHLVNQEKAKFHGKAKTKHLRLALALHLFEQVQLRRTSETWAMEIATRHVVAALALGTYLDMVTEKLATFFESTMASSESAVPATPAGAAAAVRVSARQQLQALLTTSWDFYTTDACTDDVSSVLWLLCKLILGIDTVWIDSGSLGRRAQVKQICGANVEGGALHKLARAANVLQHLDLVTTVMNKNTHGSPGFFIVKRHLQATTPGHQALLDLLGTFDVAIATYRSFSAASIQEHRPNHATALPSFSAIDGAILSQRQLIVQQWRAASYRNAEAHAAQGGGPRSIN